MEETMNQEIHHSPSSSNDPSVSPVESSTTIDADTQSNNTPSTTRVSAAKQKGKLLDKIELFQVKNPASLLEGPKTSFTPNFKTNGPPGGNMQHKRSKSFQSTIHDTQEMEDKVQIDTATPFDSVKSEVSKFGGIVDWKAHRSQIEERHKNVESELSQTQAKIPEYKKQSEAAEVERDLVLNELDGTLRYIEELKVSLEKAQVEEAQAKQDSELVILRVKEMDQGIAAENSLTAQAELDVAKSRHAAAIEELESVQKELEIMRNEYAASLEEKEAAITKAREATSASKDIEKRVEDLTLELISVKESLESAHSAHIEAEEHRLRIESAKDEDSQNWKEELRVAENELQKLNEKVLSMRDLQSKLDTASMTLLSLKNELASFAEAKINQESQSILQDNQGEAKKLHTSKKRVLEELEEVKISIDKAQEEVNFLRVAAVSLKTELEADKTALAHAKQKEKIVPPAISSLQAEIHGIEEEIKHFEVKEQEARNQMVELPISLEQATREGEEARSLAHSAKELQKAKDELEQVKANVNIAESRLHAALKEIDAAKSSEELAHAAIRALQEGQPVTSTGTDDSKNHISLKLDEYYALSKKAHDAEQAANERMATAFSQVEAATDSEAQILEKLAEATREVEERKEALRQAMKKVKDATEGKLAAEQELRQWRATSEQRRRASETSSLDSFSLPKSPRMSFEEQDQPSGNFITLNESRGPISRSSSRNSASSASLENNVHQEKKAKKKSFFPRIVMFLARKKAHHKH